MQILDRFGSLVMRILLSLIFIISGFSKLTDISGTAAYISSKGLPLPTLGAIGVGIMLLIAGLMILLGIRARWGAVALILFLIATNIFFHNPSGLPALQARLEMIQMMKNFAIMGGLFGVLVHGTGALSLDPLVNRLLKKRPSPLAE